MNPEAAEAKGISGEPPCVSVRGLVIGRFQPLHKGHEAVIRTAIEDCVRVVVGIGSSNAQQSVKNPFSFEERKQMVQSVFGDTVEVVAVPDIHDPPNWVDHVVDTLGPIQRVYGNDERTLSLFEDAGLHVRRTGLRDRGTYEGRTIRMQVAEGDREWRKSVPAPVVKLLDEWNADKRLRTLELAA